jgi:hypothetical protein
MLVLRASRKVIAAKRGEGMVKRGQVVQHGAECGGQDEDFYA